MNQLVLSNGFIVKISQFPANHGITTNKFGNCGFSKPRALNFKLFNCNIKLNSCGFLDPLEKKQNLRLMKLVNASCFFKIVPEHKDRIIEVKTTSRVLNYLKCDAIICRRPPKSQKPVLISNTADCPIIFLSDKDKNFIAIIHSGWRGTVRNIVGQTVEKIKICFDAEVENVQAGIWGGICPYCYKVSNDLKKYFPNEIVNGHLNLRNIITKQLLNSGILPKNIFLTNNFCSAHSLDTNDFLFASYRRDKNQKRNAAFITF